MKILMAALISFQNNKDTNMNSNLDGIVNDEDQCTVEPENYDGIVNKTVVLIHDQ